MIQARRPDVRAMSAQAVAGTSLSEYTSTRPMSIFRGSCTRFRRLAAVWGLVGILSAILAAGCSTTTLVNVLVPNDYRVFKDEAYGQGPRRKLDVYLPELATDQAPVIIFFHGGNWQSGDKEMYLFVAQAFAPKGFVVVIPNYRLYPEVRYPAFLQDGAAAVRWTVAHIAEKGGDPNRIYLMGHSAGAYIAAMLSLDPQWLGEVGIDPRRQIRAMVGLAGPYDFLPLDTPALKVIFGPEDQWPGTQPINHVDGNAPPMLLMAGRDDDVVDPGNTARLAARIRAKGGAVEEKYYSGIGHERLVGALAAPLHFLAPVLEDITRFIDADRRR